MEGKVTGLSQPKLSKNGKWYRLVEIDGDNYTLFGESELDLLEQCKNMGEGTTITFDSKEGKINPILTEIIATEVGGDEFRPANKVAEPKKSAKSDSANKMAEALETFILVFGREPKTDGEFASVNSIFIHLTRK